VVGGYRVAGIRRVVLAQQTRCGPVRPVESASLWCSLSLKHVYEVRPRKDERGVDLISDVLPFGRMWYGEPDHAIGYAMHSSRSYDAAIRVYDVAGNVTETQEHKGEFKEW
jgi:hypothetical protein